jgi:hypothetical protein
VLTWLRTTRFFPFFLFFCSMLILICIYSTQCRQRSVWCPGCSRRDRQHSFFLHELARTRFYSTNSLYRNSQTNSPVLARTLTNYILFLTRTPGSSSRARTRFCSARTRLEGLLLILFISSLFYSHELAPACTNSLLLRSSACRQGCCV